MDDLTIESLVPASGVDLAGRAVPRQKRAIERREAILQAMLSLLADRDIEEISTTLVAAQAGVPVASVYRYFPNKFAILSELAREAMDAVDSRLEMAMDTGTDSLSIAAAIDRTIDTVIEGYRGVAGVRRLFRNIRLTAAMEDVLAASDLRMIAVLARQLGDMRPDLSVARLQAIARTAVYTFTELQFQAIGCDDPALYPMLIEEWRRLMKAYLLPYAKS
ncbi:MAG: TetR/AcrR family transcriptional regulator [Aliidongia sp.]